MSYKIISCGKYEQAAGNGDEDTSKRHNRPERESGSGATIPGMRPALPSSHHLRLVTLWQDSFDRAAPASLVSRQRHALRHRLFSAHVLSRSTPRLPVRVTGRQFAEAKTEAHLPQTHKVLHTLALRQLSLASRRLRGSSRARTARSHSHLSRARPRFHCVIHVPCLQCASAGQDLCSVCSVRQQAKICADLQHVSGPTILTYRKYVARVSTSHCPTICICPVNPPLTTFWS